MLLLFYIMCIHTGRRTASTTKTKAS